MIFLFFLSCSSAAFKCHLKTHFLNCFFWYFDVRVLVYIVVIRLCLCYTFVILYYVRVCVHVGTCVVMSAFVFAFFY